jgi:hypothetical protein
LAVGNWMVEIVLIGIGTQDATHRRDVETEEAPAWCVLASDL